MYKTMTLNDVRAYYGRRYKRILDALEFRGATDFEVDTDCHRYLQVKCNIGAKRITVNIGINNKYNTWVYRSGIWKRESFSTMTETASYIMTI